MEAQATDSVSQAAWTWMVPSVQWVSIHSYSKHSSGFVLNALCRHEQALSQCARWRRRSAVSGKHTERQIILSHNVYEKHGEGAGRKDDWGEDTPYMEG